MNRRARLKEALKLDGIALIILTSTVVAAAYVHENMRAWEAGAILAALASGIVPAAWYLCFRRRGRVAGVLAATFLAFSFSLALLHGWMQQVEIFLIAVSGAFMAGFAVWAVRMHRDFDADLRAIGVTMKGAALFRDDGERIIVYPKRVRVFVRTLPLIPITLFCAFFLFVPLRSIVEDFVFLAASYFTAILTLLVVSLFYRILLRGPTVIIGPDGITDQGSLFATGAGLIQWDEILGVVPEYRNRMQHYLTISVTDARAIWRRLPLAKRLLRALYAPWSHVFRIWQPLLDEPVAVLSDRIKHYAETHAPEGWFGDDGEDDGLDTTWSTTSE